MGTAKKAGLVLLGLIVIGGISYASYGYGRSTGCDPTKNLEKMGHLVSLRVNITDVIDRSDKHWYGDVKVLLIAKGDALIATDIRKAKNLAKNDVEKTLTILLPKPEVLSPRLDHKRTKLYNSEVGWLRSSEVAPKTLAEAMEEGQDMVEYALLLALVAIAAISAWSLLGGKIKNSVSVSANSITSTAG